MFTYFIVQYILYIVKKHLGVYKYTLVYVVIFYMYTLMPKRSCIIWNTYVGLIQEYCKMLNTTVNKMVYENVTPIWQKVAGKKLKHTRTDAN